MSRSAVLDSLALPVTQAECAERLGITRRRMEIMEKQALTKLRSVLRQNGYTVEDFRELVAKSNAGIGGL